MNISITYLILWYIIELSSENTSAFVIPSAGRGFRYITSTDLFRQKERKLQQPQCYSRKFATPNPLINPFRPIPKTSPKNGESGTVDDENQHDYSKQNPRSDQQSQTKQSPLFRKTLRDAVDVVDTNDETTMSEFDNSIVTDWTAPNSLGSFILRMKRIEEAEIQKIAQSETKKVLIEDNATEQLEEDAIEQGPTQTRMNMNRVGKGIINETDNTSVQEEVGQIAEDGMIDREENLIDEDKNNTQESEESLSYILDDDLVRELNEAVTLLSGSNEDLTRDIKVFPTTSPPISVAPSVTNSIKEDLGNTKAINFNDDISVDAQISLPLSDSRHSYRINNDIRHLAISIASTIEEPSQWKTFCEDGGGLLPLLDCIRDGAQEIRQGSQMDDDGMLGLVEQREESLATACSACKTIRDLCAISKPFATIVTDSILNADAVWATRVTDEISGIEYSSGGLISDLVTLLRHAAQDNNISYSRQAKKKFQKMRRQGMDIKRLGSRRKIRARRKCALYTLQLMLQMVFASDVAVKGFRATSDFTDAVLFHSSYTKKERSRRRWIRYPTEFIKRILLLKRTNSVDGDSDIGSLIEETQGAANQILAAIGHNVWYPKRAGQRGLRILSIDGGGTRGITAITSMQDIVEAMGGVEVCDAFDMIAGTSTGAIIAFLIGLRRESNIMARKRYDQLMKRVFVKSVLSKPMLVFTTATYDETPFNNVMGEILRDNSMLASRADPRVPLVFAVSSKMSSTPTQLCLFRNYNYNGGEKEDAFVQDPVEARKELDLEPEDDIMRSISRGRGERVVLRSYSPRPGKSSRHPGSFRVLQRAAMRATTAAPTVFKPVLMSEELYCDGGIVASNPTAVAIHEARTIFPDVPIEMIVSCGTGAFIEEKNAPRIGWDGIIGQIVDSATDAEQPHHILEDILGQGGTAQLGRSPVSETKYYRFNPVIGLPDAFAIDGTDPEKLEELSNITRAYMKEPEEVQKLQEIRDILAGKQGWRRWIRTKINNIIP